MVALGKRKGRRSNGEMGVVTSGNVSIFRSPPPYRRNANRSLISASFKKH